MVQCQLRDVCGVRSGDKGDISDITVFADDRETYDALLPQLSAERIAAHFGDLVTGPVERFSAPNVFAIKFVLHGALGGGASMSLRSDSQGKTHGLSLLRLRVDLPAELIARSRRMARPPSSPTSTHDSERGATHAS